MARRTSTKEYEINYYDVDYKKRLLLSSLMKYLGDIAVLNSEECGMDLDYMWENKIAWVLYKWDITIERYPKFGEKIDITTIPCAFRKFYACRKYYMEDKENKIMDANSIWFLIDIDKRKPIHIPENMYDGFGITKEDNDITNIDKIKPMTHVDYEKSFDVRYSDIDTNRHVNNVKYVEWALETVPLETILNYRLYNIKEVYEKETTYGEVIRAATQLIEDGYKIVYTHRIYDKDGKELNSAETTWIKE